MFTSSFRPSYIDQSGIPPILTEPININDTHVNNAKMKPIYALLPNYSNIVLRLLMNAPRRISPPVTGIRGMMRDGCHKPILTFRPFAFSHRAMYMMDTLTPAILPPEP